MFVSCIICDWSGINTLVYKNLLLWPHQYILYTSIAITIIVNIFYIVGGGGYHPNPYPQHYPPQHYQYPYPAPNPPYYQQPYANTYPSQPNPYPSQLNPYPSQPNPNPAFATQPIPHAHYLNPSTTNVPVPPPYSNTANIPTPNPSTTNVPPPQPNPSTTNVPPSQPNPNATPLPTIITGISILPILHEYLKLIILFTCT